MGSMLTCSCCGKAIRPDHNVGSEDFPLCSSCYTLHYNRCARCGALILENHACYYSADDGEELPYCGTCYHTLCEKEIHDYYYKPAPLFYGEPPRYFGVELEIDCGGESSAKARQLLDLANAEEELIYIKRDGSLDDGCEIVTHPMSLAFHRTRMPWAALMRKAAELGYTSHQARTCGLHIHVSRAALGADEEQQDAAIARILWFYEKHWEELLKFSRRTPRQLERWAARYGFKAQPKEVLDAAKGSGAGRYACVNLQNADTVEFRIFRGSLKPSTLLAALELTNQIIDCALYLSDSELQQMSWSTFVSGCQAPALVQYLKERRIYVNDPVESAGEL